MTGPLQQLRPPYDERVGVYFGTSSKDKVFVLKVYSEHPAHEESVLKVVTGSPYLPTLVETIQRSVSQYIMVLTPYGTTLRNLPWLSLYPCFVVLFAMFFFVFSFTQHNITVLGHLICTTVSSCL